MQMFHKWIKEQKGFVIPMNKITRSGVQDFVADAW